jgi:hypothetical protein
MTVAQGVEVAKKHLIEVLPDYASANLQLEELEAPPFGSKWTFTFSATLPGPSNSYASNLAEVIRGRRVSKIVQIDAEEGTLISVKNATV